MKFLLLIFNANAEVLKRRCSLEFSYLFFNQQLEREVMKPLLFGETLYFLPSSLRSSSREIFSLWPFLKPLYPHLFPVLTLNAQYPPLSPAAFHFDYLILYETHRWRKSNFEKSRRPQGGDFTGAKYSSTDWSKHKFVHNVAIFCADLFWSLAP